jgi:hypothetical protein
MMYPDRTLSPLHAQRLLNVARACRESPFADKFTMRRHVTPCGTPACAFGNYAARPDLQSEYTIELTPSHDGQFYANEGVKWRGHPCTYDDQIVRDHFGLEYEEIEELFGELGCGKAKTNIQAAEYIERFVAQRTPKPVPAPEVAPPVPVKVKKVSKVREPEFV